MSAWVTFFSTWSVEWPSKKSGTNWQRTQPTPARNSPFFYSPNLKSCQTSDFLDYIKLYARSKRTQPAPARNSPFFLLSQPKGLTDFLDYIKLDARSNRTQPNLTRNSLFCSEDHYCSQNKSPSLVLLSFLLVVVYQSEMLIKQRIWRTKLTCQLGLAQVTVLLFQRFWNA